MNSSIKQPPLFIESVTDYETWKKDIELWTLYTDLGKEKWAIAII